MQRYRALSAKLASRFTLLVALFVAYGSQATDIEAGKNQVAQHCAQCHRPKDWSGETTAALELLINDIVAGKISHSQRKLVLTPRQSANIAAYWTSARK